MKLWRIRCYLLGWHVHVSIDGYNLCARCGTAMTQQGQALPYPSDHFLAFQEAVDMASKHDEIHKPL